MGKRKMTASEKAAVEKAAHEYRLQQARELLKKFLAMFRDREIDGPPRRTLRIPGRAVLERIRTRG
jgi:hypothetical protein